MENTEEINKEKNYKKYKPLFIITLLIAIISIVMNINNIDKSPAKKTTLTYVSISTRNEYIYANFNVTTNKTVVFEDYDFAILINDTPIIARGFITGYAGLSSIIIGDDITVLDDTTINVSFDYKLADYPNPQFLYKGQIIKLGQTIKI